MSKTKREKQLITSTSGLRIRNSKIKEWIQSAIDQGFEVHRSVTNHIIVTNPETGAISPQTTTHVEGRTLLNYRSSLRKIGVKCG